MRNLLLIGFLGLVFALGLSQRVYAECFNTGVTVSGGNIIDCSDPLQFVPLDLMLRPPLGNTTMNFGDEINLPANSGISVTGTAGINASGGADIFNINGGIVRSDIVAVGTSSGADTVIMDDGEVSSTGANAMQMGGANDFLQMNGGIISSTTATGVDTGQNDDVIEMNGGTITGNPVAIDMDSQDDMLTIRDGTINGDILMGTSNDTASFFGGTFNSTDVRMEQGNDTVNLIGDVVLDLIVGGGGGGDTLIFTLTVPAAQVPTLTNQIQNANPAGDSIVINGITYTWTTFESLVADLNGTVTTMLLTPLSADNPIFTDHTVTATVNTDGFPTVGVLVTFDISEGPNTGFTSGVSGTCSPNPDCTTDSDGVVSWTYASDFVGTDTIIASINDQFLGTATSNTAEKNWMRPQNVPTLSEWGLIAMASVLGIVGFMVMRRRIVAA